MPKANKNVINPKYPQPKARCRTTKDGNFGAAGVGPASRSTEELTWKGALGKTALERLVRVGQFPPLLLLLPRVGEEGT